MKLEELIKKIETEKGVEKILDNEIIENISSNLERHRVHVLYKTKDGSNVMGHIDYIFNKGDGDAFFVKAEQPKDLSINVKDEIKQKDVGPGQA